MKSGDLVRFKHTNAFVWKGQLALIVEEVPTTHTRDRMFRLLIDGKVTDWKVREDMLEAVSDGPV
jgi:hypothetical protein